MKDPAFLFYPNDYLGGTTGMTLEEKGAYMELLIMQFNKGAFTMQQAKKLLKDAFERLWEDLKEKFVEQDGRFFNERLEKERFRRHNFIAKQSEVGKKGGRPKIKNEEISTEKNPNETQIKPNPFQNQNPNETNKENENRIENITEAENIFEKSEKLLVVPEMLKVWKAQKPDYYDDQEKDFEPLHKIYSYLTKILKLPENILIQSEKNKSDVCRRWGELSAYISNENFFKNYSLAQVERHFQSILQKKQNGSSKTNSKRSTRDQAASDFLEMAREEYQAFAGGKKDN